MSLEKWFDKRIRELRDDVEFQLEGVLIDIAERVCERMEEQNISRADLAKKLGVSRAFVTKLLNGNPNMTVKTLLLLARALDCELDISFPPKGFKVIRHFYLPKTAEVREDMSKYVEEVDSEGIDFEGFQPDDEECVA